METGEVRCHEVFDLENQDQAGEHEHRGQEEGKYGLRRVSIQSQLQNEPVARVEAMLRAYFFDELRFVAAEIEVRLERENES